MSLRRAALWMPWVMLAVVVGLLTLVVMSSPDEPETAAERVQRLSGEVRCPECAGQAVAGSQANSARAVRDDITRRVSEGQTDDEILTALANAYGDDILLRPESSGSTSVLWFAPVVLGVAGTFGIVMVIRRRALPSTIDLSDADRARVEDARRKQAAS